MRAELWLAPPTAAQLWPALLANVWPRAPDRPVCLLAPLTGDASLIGRFGLLPDAERAAAAEPANARPCARRATGGRTLRAGDGCAALALALPRTGALLPDGRDVPPVKIVNRFVRPALGALAALGLPAAYFGRDFISVNGRAVAALGWDAQRSGAALFECLIGFDRALVDDPQWAAAGVPLPAGDGAHADLAAVLRRGFAERLSVELGEAQPAPPPQGESPWPAEERLPSGHAEREVPIGKLHAFADALRVEQTTPRAGRSAPRIARAALRGDFQADAESVAALEQSLAGCPAVFDEVGARVDAAFGPRAAGAIVGLKSLVPITEALLEAAKAEIG